MMEIPDIDVADLLRNSKIRVNPEQSEEIQAFIYSIGGGWFGTPDFRIRYTDMPYLFIDSAFFMRPGGFDEALFLLSPYREMTYREAQEIAIEYYSNLF